MQNFGRTKKTRVLGLGCTRLNFVHFCHISEKKCDQISCRCEVQPMFLGKQQINLQGSRRLVIGSRCTCDDFCFFFVKTSATPIGETGHNFKWDHFDILANAKGRSDVHCKIKETLLIRDLKPALNENVGSEKLYLY